MFVLNEHLHYRLAVLYLFETPRRLLNFLVIPVRHLYEGGVYLQFSLFVANDSMVTEHLNFACLKSHFLYLKTLLQSRKIIILGSLKLDSYRICFLSLLYK